MHRHQNAEYLRRLSALSKIFLGVAIEMCEAEYLTAVENTIQFVSANLAKMGISD
jgi:hypothetical protein